MPTDQPSRPDDVPRPEAAPPAHLPEQDSADSSVPDPVETWTSRIEALTQRRAQQEQDGDSDAAAATTEEIRATWDAGPGAFAPPPPQSQRQDWLIDSHGVEHPSVSDSDLDPAYVGIDHPAIAGHDRFAPGASEMAELHDTDLAVLVWGEKSARLQAWEQDMLDLREKIASSTTTSAAEGHPEVYDTLLYRTDWAKLVATPGAKFEGQIFSLNEPHGSAADWVRTNGLPVPEGVDLDNLPVGALVVTAAQIEVDADGLRHFVTGYVTKPEFLPQSEVVVDRDHVVVVVDRMPFEEFVAQRHGGGA